MKFKLRKLSDMSYNDLIDINSLEDLRKLYKQHKWAVLLIEFDNKDYIPDDYNMCITIGDDYLDYY